MFEIFSKKNQYRLFRPTRAGIFYGEKTENDAARLENCIENLGYKTHEATR
jgi:hypothetical protein